MLISSSLLMSEPKMQPLSRSISSQKIGNLLSDLVETHIVSKHVRVRTK